ncbi:MAG: glycosyltransferase [Anaerolineae bacterium]
MSEKPAVVGYIGAFKPDYARNQIIRAGLVAHSWHVRTAPLPVGLPTWRKIGHLWASMWRLRDDVDFFLLAEFNQLLAPFAILFGAVLGRPVVVDYLVGLYESSVIDRETVAPESWRARLFRWIDALNCRLAKAIFTDTHTHRAFLRELVGPAADRLFVVPVGVDNQSWQGAGTDAVPKDRLQVHFFGTYIPFHGVEVIVQAAHLLAEDPRFLFVLVGRGQTYPAVRAEAEQIGVRNVRFVDMLPPDELPAYTALADICLGVFGDREKTNYVVPNKLYQYMALGKPVITAESAAVREFFTPDVHLVTVPPGDAQALADALRALADDPERRVALGQAAAERVQGEFTPEQVVLPLLERLGTW